MSTDADDPARRWTGGSTTDDDPPASGAPSSPRARFWRRFRRQRPGLAAAVFLLALTGIAVLAPLLAPLDPDEQNLRDVLAGPGASGHLLGTDQFGRDVLSRLLVAGRISLLAAVQATGVAVLLGVPLGLVGAYLGGRFDRWVVRISDAFMSFPPLILAVAIVAARGPGLGNAMFAVGLVTAPRLLRLVRSAVLSVREETYIEAARSIGTPSGHIIRRHVLPNVLSPLLVQLSLVAAFAMLAEATLSFLGLGVVAPQASWGSMLQEGARFLSLAPHLVVLPGIAIAAAVLALNVLGDGLRDSLGREIRSGQ
ncbi:ABC transporter permease [Saccharopolyspora sp. HNM0983]|uniref:ABC transporter permease n=1 Tax=Saccharopolyspora montiporae TaxID=2781240 RepID=A0A929G041_9PSEU|nr:ABC transporter permease [Saccharopolyspora sp. HNM0983]MBE9375200.1 ABC transporter permease [Saccharopolyspora sp. HNM0983]